VRNVEGLSDDSREPGYLQNTLIGVTDLPTWHVLVTSSIVCVRALLLELFFLKACEKDPA
jgi:hypothetical protein